MSISETELMVDVIEWLKNWFISLMDFNDKKKEREEEKKGEEEEGKGEDKKINPIVLHGHLVHGGRRVNRERETPRWKPA